MNQPRCKRKHEYGPFQLIEQCPGHAWKSVSAKDRCKITTDSQIEEWQSQGGKKEENIYLSRQAKHYQTDWQ